MWEARRAAKRAKSRAVIGYPSGQDGVILLTHDCPICSRNNILPKSKQLYESYLSQNIFRNSKKIVCHFSLGMEIKNEKTDTHHHFYIQLAFFPVLEDKQVRRSSFAVLFMPCNKSFSYFGQDGWILALFSFYVFMELDLISVHENAKREIGQYPAILTSCLVNNKYI